MRSLLLVLALALAACTSDPAPEASGDDPSPAPEASDPAEVSAFLDRLDASYDDGLGDLGTFRVFGAGTSLYYVAATDSTGTNYELVRDPDAGAPTDRNAIRLYALYPPNTRYLARSLRNATLRGPVERNGAQTYVLETDNPRDVGIPPARETNSHLARVYLDAETLDVREIFHRFRADTLAQPLAQRTLYEEYREVGGVRLPYRVRQVQEGLLQIISEEQRIMKGGELGLREQQAQMMPPAQRDSVLREIAREKRFFTEGVNEVILRIDSVAVGVEPPETLAAPGI
ncbi:MAG: hypothetical protein AAFQ43_09305 [Bacteroidota bacterium]